ncbi:MULTISPECIES: S1 family peptidase [Vibrio]|uniref:Serine protease n=2 Tax=Vibrio TaxID=662 RepID=A0A7X4LL17_9VIBR|nr:MULTISPECIES: serine protease [Vibrio]MBF9002754.1 trypsin-like peptidase domain-containing protein [Vibrio nitrifigilis]MZI93755.1 serine protease [Vibrio eleionomae]
MVSVKLTLNVLISYRKIRVILTCILANVLGGCVLSNGPTSIAKLDQAPTIHYEFMGVPLLLQGFGSSVPITDELSLTAAHVARGNWATVVAYHPQCDIALIKSDNHLQHPVKFGLIYVNEPVKTYGSDVLGRTITGKGFYRIDLTFTGSRYFSHCNASVMDAPIRKGMSGGGAFNDKGELVGIIAAMADPRDTHLVSGDALPYKRLSIFLSLNFVRNWLDSEVSHFYKQENKHVPKLWAMSAPTKHVGR